ncbi:MAG: hypothetical protein MSG64_06260 [Pyrinomonadaceae bacterium MAG19_C2-C3]|nr:hypothetical protein [Pyrinomonadaceae bacterium MAG19_C2-C3]
MSTPSRKIIGVVAFVVALITAIALTRFAVTRLAQPENVAPPVATTTRTAPVGFVVQQSIIDFKRRTTYTTLRLERNSDSPTRVWVWTHYFSPDKAGVSWSAAPVTINAPFADADRRIVTVTGECPRAMCDRVPQDKTAYYARVFVTDESPEASQPTFTSRDFDIMTATPVLLQGIDARR